MATRQRVRQTTRTGSVPVSVASLRRSQPRCLLHSVWINCWLLE
ncbi:hypothetical protein [Pseudorhodoferax sp. Leaf274]|nr:hypothetical protein [Pseudorhodoferax sp. Leaf274]